jgi:cholesterol oxidase
MTNEHFDAVIVGSGFGGAVTACKLATAGFSVCVLERGRPYPPGSFARTPAQMRANFWDPSEGLYGMYNVWSFKHINALVASGLGGGSLIYANVLLRKDEKWFVKEPMPRGGGFEEWPVTREMLDPHYTAVERMMNVQRYPVNESPYNLTPKTHAMQQAGERLGLEWRLPPLAVTFANRDEKPVPGEPIKEPPNLHGRTRYTCRLTGECDAGCNYGSKNTLDFNYLTEAWRKGAQIRTLCEVNRFVRRPGGGYRITYRQHQENRGKGEAVPETEITAELLVLAAGTLGTTYLLLKNRDNLPGLSPALGHRFCGNGDLLAFAERCEEDGEKGVRRPRPMDASSAPVITSTLRMPDAADGGVGRGFYIQDAGYPAFLQWVLELSQVTGVAKRSLFFGLGRVKSMLGIGRDPDIGAEIADLWGPASSRPLPFSSGWGATSQTAT